MNEKKNVHASHGGTASTIEFFDATEAVHMDHRPLHVHVSGLSNGASPLVKKTILCGQLSTLVCLPAFRRAPWSVHWLQLYSTNGIRHLLGQHDGRRVEVPARHGGHY